MRPTYRASAIADATRSTASAMRFRAHRREVLPNMAASLRSDSGFPLSMLARLGGHRSRVDVLCIVFADRAGSVHVGPAGLLLGREPVTPVRPRLIWAAGPARTNDRAGATVTRTTTSSVAIWGAHA
jgi:hypothetical protein